MRIAAISPDWALTTKEVARSREGQGIGTLATLIPGRMSLPSSML